MSGLTIWWSVKPNAPALPGDDLTDATAIMKAWWQHNGGSVVSSGVTGPDGSAGGSFVSASPASGQMTSRSELPRSTTAWPTPGGGSTWKYDVQIQFAADDLRTWDEGSVALCARHHATAERAVSTRGWAMPWFTVYVLEAEKGALLAAAARDGRSPRDQVNAIVRDALEAPGDGDGKEDATAMTDSPVRDASMMDIGAYRTALPAILERIAVALETANANDPIAAIERAIAEGRATATVCRRTRNGERDDCPLRPRDDHRGRRTGDRPAARGGRETGGQCRPARLPQWADDVDAWRRIMREVDLILGMMYGFRRGDLSLLEQIIAQHADVAYGTPTLREAALRRPHPAAAPGVGADRTNGGGVMIVVHASTPAPPLPWWKRWWRKVTRRG